MTNAFLDVEELTIASRGARLVDGLSFQLARGEILGLVGESGSGKSLTARAIARLLPNGLDVTGSITLDGRDVLALRGRRLRQLRGADVSMVFQDPRAHVDPLWRVGDHLITPLRRVHGLSRAAAGRRAIELLGQAGIRDPERVLAQRPDQLSGGMLQRVVIAGALASEPALLIADEPTTALDVTTQAGIVRTLVELQRDRQLATLFITHDLDLAATICDRVMVLYAGRATELGSTAAVFDDPAHPYTRGLLGARPRLDGPRESLTAIAGIPVGGADAPAGCAFAPRCPHAVLPVCDRRPPLTMHAGRLVSCHRVEELAHGR
jgi:oligopeptide/dipeptide ABC transporter ATP-binding protein